MSDYDDFDSDYYDDFDDYGDEGGYGSYDEEGYESYDDAYESESGYDDYYYYEDEEEEAADDYTSTDIDLDSLIDHEAEPAQQKEGKSRRWLWIVGGLVGVFVILPLLCFLVITMAGLGAMFAFLPAVEEMEVAAVENTPVATLIPTAAVVIDTATPEASPTPTMAPLAAEFISPLDGAKIDLGDTVEVEVRVMDGAGITSVALEGSGLAPDTFNGESEVVYTKRWAPENAGFYALNVTVRNRLGETSRIEGITVQVVDRGFITANAPTFNQLNANVTAMRGLPLEDPIEPILMGTDGVRRYLRSEYTPEDAYQEMLVLSSFDFVPRGFDLYEPAVEYSTNGIAGFYEPATDIFVVVSTDNEVNTYEQLIYVHELMHALQDQHFELAILSDADNLTNDEIQALRALAEGEADLVQEFYLDSGYFTNAEVVDIVNEVERRLRILNDIQQRYESPEIWSRTFLFAYDQGIVFARDLYNRFGWDGLNEAWANLPVSTEQILHPERYIDGDVPLEVSIVGVAEILGDGWVEIDNNVFGEFYLREFLSQQLDPASVNQAASGWGGDRYVVYYNEAADEALMAIRIAWDTPLDSQQFAGAFTGYANAAYGNPVSQNEGVTCRTVGQESICTAAIGTDWIIVRAPTIELAKQVIAAQQ